VDLRPPPLGVVLGLVDDEVRLVLALDACSREARDAAHDVGAVREADAEGPVREAGLPSSRVEELSRQPDVEDPILNRIGQRK
jgi:hypothetical protein